jgi:hypothetical protein
VKKTAVLAACIVTFLPAAGAAQCPAGLTAKVDNDIPGSGYSEIKPENWTDWATDACYKVYRYLTQHQGDGTRKGKAIWKPAITVAGNYEVVTSFRGSTNRGTDVDYFAYGDDGATIHKKVNQQAVSGCQYVTLGTIFCAVGGECRAVLDGNDGQSAAADITTFTLKNCGSPQDGGTPDAGGGPCAAIASTPGFEVCEATDSTCAGVFTNGAGCTAYCAAAGMVCAARFGGEPGCSKEPENPLSCDDNNGHQSDWCECTFPPGYDAGTPDAGTDEDSGGEDAAGADAGQPGDEAGLDDTGPISDAGEEPPEDAAVGEDAGLPEDASAPAEDGGTADTGNASPDMRAVPDAGRTADSGDGADAATGEFDYGIGCGCATVGSPYAPR